MEAIIQFVQAERNATAKELVKEKLDKIGEKYDWIIRAEVFFKEEKDSQGKGKICEIRLSAPGPRIFAQSDRPTFEEAVSETINELEVLLKKRKSEMIEHI